VNNVDKECMEMDKWFMGPYRFVVPTTTRESKEARKDRKWML
jgi:hypothetical protein